PLWMKLSAEVPELTAPLAERFSVQPSGSPQANPSLATKDFTVVGQRLPRSHGIGIVTAVGHYAQNVATPGMVFMKILRSPYPHAKVKSIDTSKAEKLKGVLKILHRGNLPKDYQNAAIEAGPPRRFLFGEEIYQVGAPVAAIAAETDHIADEALRM